MNGHYYSAYLGVTPETRSQLAGHDDFLPPETRSFVPVSHATLVNEVISNLEVGGLKVVEEAYGVSKSHQRMFGLIQIEPENPEPDYKLIVGVRNSNDKSFPAALSLGSYVNQTGTLAFSSEVLLARKHTTFIMRDLPSLTTRAVSRLMDARGKQARRIEAYKSFEVTDMQANDMIVRMFEHRVYPVTKFPEILRHWKHPKYEVFKDRTLWSLTNAVAQALKPSSRDRGGSLFELPRRTQAMYGILDMACGLAGAPTSIFEALAEGAPAPELAGV